MYAHGASRIARAFLFIGRIADWDEDAEPLRRPRFTQWIGAHGRFSVAFAGLADTATTEAYAEDLNDLVSVAEGERVLLHVYGHPRVRGGACLIRRYGYGKPTTKTRHGTTTANGKRDTALLAYE